MPVELPILTVANVTAWREWLARSASASNGVWLTLAKKGTTTPTSLTMDEALEEALCYGWINGQGRSIDFATTSQRFTPRRERSAWSKRNVGFVERLEKEGRMQEAGRAAVQAAKADGRWDSAYGGSAGLAPPDLLRAMDEVPSAKATWDGLSSQDRYAIYFRLIALKSPAARTKRIETFIDMLARGESPISQKPALRKSTARVSKAQPSKSAAAAPARKTRSGRSMPAYKE